MLAKPVLVCAQTNMDRMVISADCGLVLPYNDVPALEAALEQLASDTAFRRCLGENARRAYEEHYSWEIMQARLRAVYASLSTPSSQGVAT
jgi:glycosyltransferase involved in cell wall biosynthesis